MNRLLATAVLACLGCDSGMGTTPDGGLDATVSDIDASTDSGTTDAGPQQTLPACEDTEDVGEGVLAPVASTLVGTIVPEVARAAGALRQNPATEDGEVMYRAMRLDRYARGPGHDHARRTDLGGEAAAGTRRSIAYFAHLSDFQLVDDESPARLASFDNPATSGALRSQEAWLPHAISAMNRTLARVARPARGYDFGIVTGDCADSAQENELRWVIELMNGQPGTELDSGDDDDPVPGPDNDPKDPFDPVAFPGPWLYVPGNHDVEVVGVSAPTDALRAQAIGTRPVGGARDYRRWYAPASMRTITADPERRILDREDIVAMLLADSNMPGPVGHGYPAAADVSLGANYVYDAIPGLLRIVALDTSDLTGGSEGLVLRATVDGFLVPALEQAELDGVLVMLASHHATTSIDVFPGQLGTTPLPDAVPPAELETLIAGYANVIAWLVGHSHDNRIRPIAGPDAAHPGYWEIMTSAIADWPGQSRVIELVDNGNGTLSIYGTLVDFDTDTCMERRYRRLLTMEWSAAWSDPVHLEPEHRNVELVRAIPATAATAVSEAAEGDRIESETTLRGL
ncbi:MAG: hypothetical protein IT378_21930 [Sandaracinaceae bacterium]|nr:hypothetical protein [Sandaracinaceae bacterium]